MREDTRKRLDRALRIEQMKKAVVGLAVVAAIGLMFAYQNLDMLVETTEVAGTITGVDPLVSKTNAADGEAVHVKLDDGRSVDVLVLKTRQLHAGDHIQVTEHHHATGRVTHTLK
jgi:hypothetical protein